MTVGWSRDRWVQWLKDNEIPLGAYDYIIYKEDNSDYVLAKNGRAGKIEFKGENIGEVLESAVQALREYGGGSIYIAKGEYTVPARHTYEWKGNTYNIGILLYNASNVHIEGAGIGATVIKAETVGNWLIYNDASSNFTLGN